jgi:molybdopterin-guanine dinucleotide biosynthesis protein MobB
VRIYGIVGWKNSGKTTLMSQVIAEITARGISVSAIKHTHHAVDLDRPGKDTFRHREAGASQVALASSARWAVMTELREAPEPTLDELAAKLEPVDLVLVEGFKKHGHPKVEAHRDATGKALLARDDATITAVATADPDSEIVAGLSIPLLSLDDPAGVAAFILREVGLEA